MRHWLDGGERHDETDKALAAFGLVIENGAKSSDAPFGVYAINWPVLSIFWATWNQWKKIAVGTNIIKVCIDWAQVEAALKMSGIERSEWPLIFEGLRAAETGALEWLNKD